MGHNSNTTVLLSVGLHLLLLNISCSDKNLIPYANVNTTGEQLDQDASKLDPSESKNLSELDAAAAETERPESIAETAIEPALVGGAFLTCRIEPEKTSPTNLAVGCLLPNPGLASKEAARLKFGFAQSGGQSASAMPIAPSSEQYSEVDGSWAWAFGFDRAQLPNRYLLIEVRDQAQNPDSQPIYQKTLDLLSYQPMMLIPNAYLNFGTRNGVTDGCPRMNGAPVPPRDLIYTKQFTVKTLTAGASLSVLGVCGINNGQTPTRVRVKRISSILPVALGPSMVLSSDITRGGNYQYSLPDLRLGIYQIEIEAGFYGGSYGYDDFKIQQVNLKTESGAIEL